MFEKYFQRFEELISPRNFSIQNLQKSNSANKLVKNNNQNINLNNNHNNNSNNNLNNYYAEHHSQNDIRGDRGNKKFENETQHQGGYLLNEHNNLNNNNIVKKQNKNNDNKDINLIPNTRQNKNMINFVQPNKPSPPQPHTTKFQQSQIRSTSFDPNPKIIKNNNNNIANLIMPNNNNYNVNNNNQNNKFNNEEYQNDSIDNINNQIEPAVEPQEPNYDYSDIANSNTYNINNGSQLNLNNSSNPSNSNYYKGKNDADPDFLKKKIHKINKLNMNLRFEVAKLNEKLFENERLIGEQTKKIQQLEKQKDSDSEYLLKLENIITLNKVGTKGNKSINSNNISSNSINLNTSNKSIINNKSNFNNNNNNHSQKPGSNTNKVKNNKNQQEEIRYLQLDNNFTVDLFEKNELSQLLQMMYGENQRLKFFQNNIIQLSKNYDEINENMVLWMKDVNVLVEGLPKNYDEVNFQSIIGITML